MTDKHPMEVSKKRIRRIDRVVTFCCNNLIHVYYKNSSVLPYPPYKVHDSVESAKQYLKTTRKVENPEIIYNT